MRIQIDNINIHYNVNENLNPDNHIPIIFLHGFTGNAFDWNFIINELPESFYPVAIDLPGHGKSDCPADPIYYSADALVLLLNKFIQYFNFKNVVLIGYSMGGRLALSFCIKYPSIINALILESATPGIEDNTEKKRRIEDDKVLVNMIKKEGIKKFIDYWLSLSLFSGYKMLTAEKISEVRNSKLNNNPAGLINSLLGFGTGVMPSCWVKLNTINCPTLLITGEKDEKFTLINQDIKPLIINSEHKLVRAAGHNTHLENPKEFIILVKSFLNKINL